MVIRHNMSAMNAQRQYGIMGRRKTSNMEKLSSGYRINKSADDAAGLSISEKMRRQIRGLTRGIANTQDGVSLCQVADGALHEVHDMVNRLNELAVQSSNGTNENSDRAMIQDEVDQLLTEINRISDMTTFNGQNLFGGAGEGEGELPASVLKTIKVKVMEAKFIKNGKEEYEVRYEDHIVAVPLKKSGDMIVEVLPENAAAAVPLKKSRDAAVAALSEEAAIAALSEDDGIMALDDTRATVTKGVFTVTGDGIQASDFEYNSTSKVLTIKTDKAITISGTSTTDRILVSKDLTSANITLASVDINITANNEAAFEIESGFSGDAKISLIGTNKLISGDNRAGLQKNGDRGTLTISGNGSLEARGGENGAGIGGGNGGNGSNITVDGGNVTAVGGKYGAGIGGGNGGSGSNIKITGGKADATGGQSGTGIGGGNDASGGNVQLSGGVVTVQGGANAPSIGSGQGKNDGGNNTVGGKDVATNMQGDGGKYTVVAGDKGALIIDNTTNKGTIQGDLTLKQDYTIPIGTTVNFGSGATLTVADGKTLTVGTGATLNVGNGATVNVKGNNATLNNQGTVTGIINVSSDKNFTGNNTGVTLNMPAPPPPPSNPPEQPTQPTQPIPSVPPIGGGGTQSGSTSGLSPVGQPVKKWWIQCGADATDGMYVEIDAMNVRTLGLLGLNVTTQQYADNAINRVEGALTYVSKLRSKIGAQQNRLEHTIANEGNIVENTTAAESRIRDVDMAEAMVAFSLSNLLAQAGEAMLAQANTSNEGVLTLLR